MRAAWWWIDRWRKSTAYTDMTAEAQGVYRNLIDELWLRNGALPMDDRILCKIGGDPEAWNRVKGVVLARFVEVDGSYRNETHDSIQRESRRLADKQARYRERLRNSQGNVTGNVTRSPSPSPSPSKSPSPESTDTDPSLRSAPGKPVKVKKPKLPGWIFEDWKEKQGGNLHGGQAARFFWPLLDSHGEEVVRVHWGHYLASTGPGYASPARFSSTFGSWAEPRPNGHKPVEEQKKEIPWLKKIN